MCALVGSCRSAMQTSGATEANLFRRPAIARSRAARIIRDHGAPSSRLEGNVLADRDAYVAGFGIHSGESYAKTLGEIGLGRVVRYLLSRRRGRKASRRRGARKLRRRVHHGLGAQPL